MVHTNISSEMAQFELSSNPVLYVKYDPAVNRTRHMEPASCLAAPRAGSM